MNQERIEPHFTLIEADQLVELRQWAIEQALKTGYDIPKVVETADQLLQWVTKVGK